MHSGVAPSVGMESVRHRCHRSDRWVCRARPGRFAGHQVTALARSDAKAHLLRRSGCDSGRACRCSTGRALAGVFDGHDAVVNLRLRLCRTTARFMFRSAWCRSATESVPRARPRWLTPRWTRRCRGWCRNRWRWSTGTPATRWIAEDAPVDDYPIAAGNHAAEASACRFDATGGEFPSSCGSGCSTASGQRTASRSWRWRGTGTSDLWPARAEHVHVVDSLGRCGRGRGRQLWCVQQVRTTSSTTTRPTRHETRPRRVRFAAPPAGV